ncbi:TetR/AcrR family transcriptional regulator [Wenjunlia tyrosinilytica]|uniref:TetR family transcriptional regulator n=1 Tax=Wenjunlia tyrosinilytica TaxID=1544741 RepID=A0A917ZKR4_9ACTN|nr:TetR/AcrR family transcriptional regulator [Wenjunlia tyrosinilytica]GGO85691.1 TetR family transcriptional regulator [Wenjunlia tyrosinilytica]
MPTARETLLDSALAALGRQPWSDIRMVEVAEAARVSRQTLYNEFGSKDGLARALTRREVEAFIGGVERALAGAERSGADAGGAFAAAASWTLLTAEANPLVRSVLIGGHEQRTALMPRCARPTPSELVELLRERAIGAIEHGYPKLGLVQIGAACEAAVRLTLSYAVAPGRTVEDACAQVAALVRHLLAPGW